MHESVFSAFRVSSEEKETEVVLSPWQLLPHAILKFNSEKHGKMSLFAIYMFPSLPSSLLAA